MIVDDDRVDEVYKKLEEAAALSNPDYKKQAFLSDLLDLMDYLTDGTDYNPVDEWFS